MLRRVDTTWTLQAMMADMDSKLESRFVYDYGEVAFVGGVGKGARLTSWLKCQKGRLAGFRFSIPKLQENVYSDRHPSHTRPDLFLGLTQPHSLHHIHIQGQRENSRNKEPLVKSGCPSFSSLADAAYRFLYGLDYHPGQREPDDIIVRLVHSDAWLELLDLHRSAISITVAGDNVRGSRLELKAGSDVRFDVRLRKPCKRRFLLPTELPDRVWVILSRGDEWLDYRNLDLRGSKSLSESGILIDAPEVCNQVKGLIERGEGDTREFKREVPRDKNNTFLKTVAAFANSKGGVILFGVVDETWEIKGIIGDVQQQCDRVVNMIRDNVVPQPNLRVETCNLNGKRVIAIFIEEGDSPPYGLDAAKPRFYVRRGATTFPANQAEIRAFAKKFDSQPANDWLDRFRY